MSFWPLVTPTLEIRSAFPRGSDVDIGIARKADFDVEAQAVAVENVVVKADAVKGRAAVRVVDPVHVFLTLSVEAQIEDEHFVPGEDFRVVGDAREGQQAVQRRRRDEAVETDFTLRGFRDLRIESIATSASPSRSHRGGPRSPAPSRTRRRRPRGT